jgi:hypothetical protein
MEPQVPNGLVRAPRYSPTVQASGNTSVPNTPGSCGASQRSTRYGNTAGTAISATTGG